MVKIWGWIMIVGFIAFLASIVWLIMSAVRKKGKRKPVLALVVSFVVTVFAFGTANSAMRTSQTTEADKTSSKVAPKKKEDDRPILKLTLNVPNSTINNVDDYVVKSNTATVAGKTEPNANVQAYDYDDFEIEFDAKADVNGDYSLTITNKKDKTRRFLLSASKSGYKDSAIYGIKLKGVKPVATSSSSSSATAQPKPKTNGFNTGDYRTDITYDQLARTPKQYKNTKFTLTGQVIQEMESKGIVQLRVAIDGNPDNVVLLEYRAKIMNGTRVLENDLITFYAESVGVTTYKATSGQSVTIPAAVAQHIDDKGTAPDDYGY